MNVGVCDCVWTVPVVPLGLFPLLWCFSGGQKLPGQQFAGGQGLRLRHDQVLDRFLYNSCLTSYKSWPNG